MARRLLFLNGIAVISVVLNHASGWGFIAMFWWTDRYLPVAVPNFDQFGSITYYALRAIEQAIIFAIPSFLFVSGFFIAFSTKKDQPTIEWRLIFSRLKILLIPYFVWSAIILLMEIAQGKQYTITLILQKLLTGDTSPPYYYIPLLTQLLLISPFLVPMARDHWKKLLVIAAVVQFFFQSFVYINILTPLPWPWVERVTQSFLFPSRIFWFSFGIVFGFHSPTMKIWIQKIKWLALICLPLIYIIGIFEWEFLLAGSGQTWIANRETITDQFFAAAFIFCLIGFEKFIPPFENWLFNLGSKSFGIYLAHAPVLEYSARIIYHVIPALLGMQWLFQVVLVSLGLGIPQVLMYALKNSPARRLYVYVFG